MAGGSSKSNAPKPRKRVEAGEDDSNSDNNNNITMVRAKDGSAFVRCEGCNKNVPVVLISMHDCSLDAKIKMNLEAQVVEKSSEAATKKPAERKKATSTEPKAKRSKTEKSTKTKDPNMPKRPPTAFFVFMDDFRKTYKEANPGAKGGKEVAKQGGEKWKSMMEEEKKAYIDKAAELKAEYDKVIANYNAESVDDEEEPKNESADDEVEVIDD